MPPNTLKEQINSNLYQIFLLIASTILIKDEVAAFEELVGSHGGLGGDQRLSICDVSFRVGTRNGKYHWC